MPDYSQNFDVKCADCSKYFHLSGVVQEGNGYYCKKCLKKLREKQRIESIYEKKCIFCNKVLRDGKFQTVGGYVYCPECRDKIAGNGKPVAQYKCSVCGELLSLYETRMVRDGKEFCEKCYHETFDESGKEKLYKCSECGIEMGRFEVKMHRGQNLCIKCYNKGPGTFESLLKKVKKGNARTREDLGEAALAPAQKGDHGPRWRCLERLICGRLPPAAVCVRRVLRSRAFWIGSIGILQQTRRQIPIAIVCSIDSPAGCRGRSDTYAPAGVEVQSNPSRRLGRVPCGFGRRGASASRGHNAAGHGLTRRGRGRRRERV